MIWTQDFPTESGIYWCDVAKLDESVFPEFIPKGATREEIIAQVRINHPSATDFYWCRHESHPVVNEAAAYLVADPDAVITLLEYPVHAAGPISYIEVTHRTEPSVVRSFGQQ